MLMPNLRGRPSPCARASDADGAMRDAHAAILSPRPPAPDMPGDRPNGGFHSVVCAVEPTLSSVETARQGALLAAGAQLELAGVAPRRSEIGAAYLSAARYVAARNGAVPIVRAEDLRARPAEAVLRRAADQDLIVVGTSDARELTEFARAAVTRASVPVLVARAAPRGADVTERVLVVQAPSADARAAMRRARSLADREGSEIIGVIDGDRRDAADEIVRAARGLDATLVVVGRHSSEDTLPAEGLSMAVARDAPCSVLIERAHARRTRAPRASSSAGRRAS